VPFTSIFFTPIDGSNSDSLSMSQQHNVVESIRSKWYGQRTSCPELDSGVESNTSAISPAHLWRLFVFTASVYAITALIHIGRKPRQRRDRGRVRAAPASNINVLSTPANCI
ncbi:hypothetical protein KI387_015381, partial [Taxus chinensis]